MKFDDSDQDYFLHDFSKSKDESPARPETDQEVMRGDRSPSFDFSDGDATYDQPRGRKKGHGWTWFFLIVFAVLAATVGIRYFVPYVTESKVTGYITLVEKRGIICRTFEGEMVSESKLADKDHVYSRDIYFSIPDEEIARRLQQYQGSGTPVTITCKRYYGTLPWRGASNNILVSFQPK